MAYEVLTPTMFKAAKPQFANVADETVQSYIDMASRMVDQSWPAADYTNGWIAFTCHLMTLDGLGTDANSKSFASGAAQYSSIRSGQLTLTRYRAQAGASTPFSDWLRTTPCGAYYTMLLRLVKGGPRLIRGGLAGPVSPYAKDQVTGVYGWPGVFLS